MEGERQKKEHDLLYIKRAAGQFKQFYRTQVSPYDLETTQQDIS